MELTDFGYDGNTFSVEREKERLIKGQKINKNFSVYVTDNKTYKPSSGTIVHSIFCFDVGKIEEIKKWLLQLELKDSGLNKKAKKPLNYLYITSKS